MNKSVYTSTNKILAILAAVSLIFLIKPVLAQVASSTPDDTSTKTLMTDSEISNASSTIDLMDASSSLALTSTSTSDTVGFSDTSSISSTTPEIPSAPATTTAESPHAGLTLVHIIGTKYIDYFTDGTTTIAIPGDPNIDSHLNERDAPIPVHAGLTWVHTTGQYLYDTENGDLDEGDYALEPIGSYIEHPKPFISSTSTPNASQESVGTASENLPEVPAVNTQSASTNDTSAISDSTSSTSSDTSSTISADSSSTVSDTPSNAVDSNVASSTDATSTP